MKSRKVTIRILVIAIVGVLAYQGWTRFSDWRIGRVLVRKSWFVEGVRWSKDGKTLYYLEGEDEMMLHSYNIFNGKRKHYHSSYVYAPYDISPDGDFVVFTDGIGLKKIRLGESKASPLLSWPYSMGEREIHNITWLPHNRILFTSRGKHTSVYVMDLKNKQLEKIPGHNMNHVVCGQDGHGFIYRDDNNYIYYYDLIKHASKRLNISVFRDPDISYPEIVFVSQHWVIYTYVFDKDRSVDLAEALNIDNNSAIKIDLPEIRQKMWFSPDLTNYWLMEIEKGEWVRPRLYRYATPENVLQQLRHNQRFK